MKILEQKANTKKEKHSELFVSICYDEMFIRKHFKWCNEMKMMLGFPTFPLPDRSVETEFRVNDLSLDEAANQSIVFIAVGLNENIKLPVAYHLIKSLNAQYRSVLVKQVIEAVRSTGAIVTNISFDGFAGNKKMCSLLGADLNISSDHFQPYFLCNDGHQINIISDVPHLMKCVRGILATHGHLIDLDGGKIEWKYFENLVKFGKTDGFNFTHKMTQSHINWKSRKMKVDLAAQTLSRSTANSMKYLMEKGQSKFINAGPTIRFTELFDNLLDIFNTKLKTNLSNDPNEPNEQQREENQFKRAIYSGNKRAIYDYFQMAIEYIKGLRIVSETGALKLLIHSRQNTGFKGFLVNIYSLMHMYNVYVEEKNMIECIPTYSLNQDAVEIFFGKCRSLNGYNDNPTFQQFKSAYRKILLHSTVFTSKEGNCINFDTISEPFSNVLFVSSNNRSLQTTNDNEIQEAIPEELDELHEQLQRIEAMQQNNLIDPFWADPTLIHIASTIETRIKMADVYCPECILAFEDNEKAGTSSIVSKYQPCRSTYIICKSVDRFLKSQFLREKKSINTLYSAIADHLEIDSLYNATDFRHDPNHKLFLIRAVVDTCFQIKSTFLARLANLTGPKHIRSHYRHLIHVYGQ